jgi:hypothetical protein
VAQAEQPAEHQAARRAVGARDEFDQQRQRPAASAATGPAAGTRRRQRAERQARSRHPGSDQVESGSLRVERGITAACRLGAGRKPGGGQDRSRWAAYRIRPHHRFRTTLRRGGPGACGLASASAVSTCASGSVRSSLRTGDRGRQRDTDQAAAGASCRIARIGRLVAGGGGRSSRRGAARGSRRRGPRARFRARRGSPPVRRGEGCSSLGRFLGRLDGGRGVPGRTRAIVRGRRGAGSSRGARGAIAARSSLAARCGRHGLGGALVASRAAGPASCGCSERHVGRFPRIDAVVASIVGIVAVESDRRLPASDRRGGRAGLPAARAHRR